MIYDAANPGPALMRALLPGVDGEGADWASQLENPVSTRTRYDKMMAVGRPADDKTKVTDRDKFLKCRAFQLNDTKR